MYHVILHFNVLHLSDATVSATGVARQINEEHAAQVTARGINIKFYF